MSVPLILFYHFEQDVADGVHKNCINADTDTLKVYLSNAAPNAATMAVKADLAEIAAGNGYTAGGADSQNAASKSAGVTTVVGTDFTITANGGSIGPFRYAVLYNDTPTAPADPLIGYWDYGSSQTLGDGEAITVDFGASMFTHG